ncbi:MAG: DinB family protein, partial [Acidobacteria bacterium]|nr:DinB family protein [Acidobacteriota bacterium]
QYVDLMQGEFPSTCKVLAAVKDEGRDYRPDAKSRSAWDLTTHLATADIWFLDSIIGGSFAFDAGKEKEAVARFTSVDDVVRFYEQAYPAKLQEVSAMSPSDLVREVDFFGMFKRPAVTFLGLANNHSTHHRGQLAAYLRALGSNVPAIYGGSADEPMMAT